MNSPQRRLRILLVEDNEFDIELIREALTHWETQPLLETANDGEKAISFLNGRAAETRSALPDLILLDLNLPKKSGVEVLRQIKSSRDLAAIPVIVLTTSDREADINQAYGNLATCYLTKPLEFASLVDRIRAVETFWRRHVLLPRNPPPAWPV